MRVIDQARWWTEYGCPIDPHSHLSNWELEAHMAIIEGRRQKRIEQAKEANKKGK